MPAAADRERVRGFIQEGRWAELMQEAIVRQAAEWLRPQREALQSVLQQVVVKADRLFQGSERPALEEAKAPGTTLHKSGHIGGRDEPAAR